MQSPRRQPWTVLWAIACSVAAGTASAQVDEARLKAAFVYNFAAFTTWPEEIASSRTGMVVCVHRQVEQSFQDALRLLEGKPARRRRVVVVALGAVGDVAECDILVTGIDGLVGDRVLHAALIGKSVLTVCDCSSPDSGVVIRMYDDGDRLAFTVDRAAAASARLVISSKLLRLARDS